MKINKIISFFALALVACGPVKGNEGSTSKQEIKQKMMESKTHEKNNEDSTSNAKEIVKTLIDAMAAKDAEKIRSMFNENASQAYGDGAPKSGKAFFSWLESDIIEREGHVEDANYSVDGNEVVVTGQYSSIGYTNKANFLFTVKDGKVNSWQMRY